MVYVIITLLLAIQSYHPSKKVFIFSLIYIIVDFNTALTSSYLAVLSGVENKYEAFWPQRIRNLGEIYGQMSIFEESEGTLTTGDIDKLHDLLVSEKYKNEKVQVFAMIKDDNLMIHFIKEICSLGKNVLFFIGGLKEKKIIEIASANGLGEYVKGNTYLHFYNDKENIEYNDIITKLSLDPVRLSHNNDVMMYYYYHIYIYIYIFIGLD